jgi:integrase-like protein
VRQRAAGAWQDDAGFVITTRYGRPVEPRNMVRSFHARSARAGVPDISVHEARRTCATLLLDRNVHPRVTMQILRHAQINVTMEIYSQAPSRQTREALRRLSESLNDKWLLADEGVVPGAAIPGWRSRSSEDGSSHTAHLEDLDVPDATAGAGFACPDLTTFARLDELGLHVTGQRLAVERRTHQRCRSQPSLHLICQASSVVALGGPSRTRGAYSSNWMRPSNVRLLIMSKATSG